MDSTPCTPSVGDLVRVKDYYKSQPGGHQIIGSPDLIGKVVDQSDNFLYIRPEGMKTVVVVLCVDSVEVIEKKWEKNYQPEIKILLRSLADVMTIAESALTTINDHAVANRERLQRLNEIKEGVEKL